MDPLGGTGRLQDARHGVVLIEAREKNPLGARMLAAEVCEELGRLHVAHVVVDDEDGDLFPGLVEVLEEVKGGVGRVSGQDSIALGVAGGEVLPKFVEDVGIVVESKYYGCDHEALYWRR